MQMLVNSIQRVLFFVAVRFSIFLDSKCFFSQKIACELKWLTWATYFKLSIGSDDAFPFSSLWFYTSYSFSNAEIGKFLDQFWVDRSIWLMEPRNKHNPSYFRRKFFKLFLQNFSFRGVSPGCVKLNTSDNFTSNQGFVFFSFSKRTLASSNPIQTDALFATVRFRNLRDH